MRWLAPTHLLVVRARQMQRARDARAATRWSVVAAVEHHNHHQPSRWEITGACGARRAHAMVERVATADGVFDGFVRSLAFRGRWQSQAWGWACQLDANQDNEKEEYEAKQKELEGICNPIMQKM